MSLHDLVQGRRSFRSSFHMISTWPQVVHQSFLISTNTEITWQGRWTGDERRIFGFSEALLGFAMHEPRVSVSLWHTDQAYLGKEVLCHWCSIHCHHHITFPAKIPGPKVVLTSWSRLDCGSCWSARPLVSYCLGLHIRIGTRPSSRKWNI